MIAPACVSLTVLGTQDNEFNLTQTRDSAALRASRLLLTEQRLYKLIRQVVTSPQKETKTAASVVSHSRDAMLCSSFGRGGDSLYVAEHRAAELRELALHNINYLCCRYVVKAALMRRMGELGIAPLPVDTSYIFESNCNARKGRPPVRGKWHVILAALLFISVKARLFWWDGSWSGGTR
jgi:hypothetical protein